MELARSGATFIGLSILPEVTLTVALPRSIESLWTVQPVLSTLAALGKGPPAWVLEIFACHLAVWGLPSPSTERPENASGTDGRGRKQPCAAIMSRPLRR